MNLINKEDGLLSPALQPVARLTDDLTNAGDTLGDRAEWDKDAFGRAGNEVGKGGFPGTRRAPEDHRARHPSLDCIPQRLARPEQMLLPNKLVQCGRTHSGCEWTAFPSSRKQRGLPLGRPLARHWLGDSIRGWREENSARVGRPNAHDHTVPQAATCAADTM